MWHELWHSLGGRRSFYKDPDPLIQRLTKYNENINPTKKSLRFTKDQTLFKGKGVQKQNMFDALKAVPENSNLSDNFLRDFVDDELTFYNFINKEILIKNHEVRSRMQAALDRLRNLGYNTSELIGHPEKFKEWINELRNNRVFVPSDLRQLLMAYDIDDLGNYASKMLTTSGGLYLGNQYLNSNYGNNKNMY